MSDVSADLRNGTLQLAYEEAVERIVFDGNNDLETRHPRVLMLLEEALAMMESVDDPPFTGRTPPLPCTGHKLIADIFVSLDKRTRYVTLRPAPSSS